jgi:DNA excision repair protein ERCC-2
MNPPTYLKTSVRNLVEFVLREGDLPRGGFQEPDRALAGSRGHRRLQKSRPEGYQAEVVISHLVETADLQLEIFGRIDGIFTLDRPITLEEIKTTTWDLHLIEADNPLHWGQAQCYAYLYARQHDLTELQVQLTYYHLDHQETVTFQRNFTFSQLESFFTDLVTTYLNWMRQVKAWHERRDCSIHQLDFPYAAYRIGQRDLAVAVYRAILKKEPLFVQAPTGIGKTIATLFPAVKAIGAGLVAKIFYLTAKTPGRLVAEQTLDDMRQAGLHLKSVTLTAKEKLCFCAATGGEPEECPFTRNYYGKVKTALAETYELEAFTRPVIVDLARRYEICPFEFSLDLALWADCIIGDYNYVFDPTVYLRRFFDQVAEPYLFLVDEAHNLPDRARAMYSAELDKQTVLALRKSLRPHLPELAQTLSKINQTLLAQRKRCDTGHPPALVEREQPAALLKALRQFNRQAEAWLALNQQTAFRPALLDFYFQAATYLRTADAFFGPGYVSYFEKNGPESLTAKLFCLDPAPFLAAVLERSRAAIFFSATLLPLDYFDRVLTGSTTHSKLVLRSPFPAEHLTLLIHNQISTQYAHRAGSYEAVAALIKQVCAAQPGNYLVFFPSYVYLVAVATVVKEHWPAGQLLIQERGMTEAARDAFLARFSAANQKTLLGFAVMGGIFGEGIDLVGERLIGAIIVGVGLPQLSLERDLLKAYFAEHGHNGFAYAYQYPGLNRVMQAAGRVIRTEQDRGVILLIDERLTQPRYMRLFPPEWRHFQVVRPQDDLQEKLRHFWQKDSR